jgi:hypothetical protein
VLEEKAPGAKMAVNLSVGSRYCAKMPHETPAAPVAAGSKLWF